RVLLDFMRGFRVLHFVGPCVTVFGSARIKEGHPSYELARKMGAAIAQLGFTVMTGGGPGIMEAANRGAKDVNGRSVGCNIDLDLIFATDSVEAAIAHIREKAITPFGLKLVVRRHLSWLGERALSAP